MSLPRYVACAFTYGALRKVAYTWNTKYQKTVYDKQLNKTVETSPILATDRVLLAGLAGLETVYLAPVFVLCDVRNAEMKLRGVESFHRASTSSYTSSYTPDIDFLTVALDFHM